MKRDRQWQVRWLSDATHWGERDYWARAGETLARGGGDDEDRAIVKLQALRALGFPARDLYLTIGRDPVGGQTILLMVRSGGRMWALDDLGGSPIPAERRVGFKPQLTLAMGGAWLHGVRVNSAAAMAAR